LGRRARVERDRVPLCGLRAERGPCNSQRRHGDLADRAELDTDGKFEFSELAPGKHVVRASTAKDTRGSPAEVTVRIAEGVPAQQLTTTAAAERTPLRGRRRRPA